MSSKNNPNNRNKIEGEKCPKCGQNLKWVKKVGFAQNGMYQMCDCGFEKKK